LLHSSEAVIGEDLDVFKDNLPFFFVWM